MTYQKIIIDKLEDSSPKSIYVWCEKRGLKGAIRCKRVNIEVCKLRSSSYNTLYDDCFGCDLWHDFLPKEKKKKLGYQKIEVTYKKIESNYQKIEVDMQYKKI